MPSHPHLSNSATFHARISRKQPGVHKPWLTLQRSSPQDAPTTNKPARHTMVDTARLVSLLMSLMSRIPMVCSQLYRPTTYSQTTSLMSMQPRAKASIAHGHVPPSIGSWSASFKAHHGSKPTIYTKTISCISTKASL